jgi:hypothetical protein
MLDAISILAALAIGILLARAFDPARNLQPFWAASLFSAALGAGAGVGITSIVFLLLDVSGVATPAAIFGADGVMLAIAAWLCFRPKSDARSVSSSQEPSPRFRWAWVLALVFAAVFIASCVRVVQMTMALPHGDWDAWTIWNLRARFLAGPGVAWRFAVSPLFTASHSDYPLLLSAFIARVWKASGNLDPIVPMATSLLFFGALLALLVSALAILRGTASALLAGLVVLSTSSLLTWAPAQYADIPLAFYFLAAIALLFLDSLSVSGRWTLLWVGLCASFAAWTKNEGIAFLAILSILFFAFTLWRRRTSQALLHGLWLLAGVAPGLLVIGWFKFFLAPVVDPLVKQGASGLAKLADFHRYAQLASGFFSSVWSLGAGVAHPLILLAILAILLRWSMEARYLVPSLIAAATLALVFASYCVALVVTPYNLSWQLQTSSDRLIVQLWPCVLLLFFVQLRSIQDAPPTAIPLKQAAARKSAVRPAKVAGGPGK